MRFSASAILAVASVAFAQSNGDSNGSNPFNIPTTSLNTEAGETVNLTWRPTTEGTVTIYLRSGPSNALNKGEAIASNIDNNGAFTWNVPDDIVRGSNYALEIVDDSDDSNTNYTPPFVIESTNNAAPSASSSSSVASSAASSMTDSSSTASETESDSSMSMTSTDSSSMVSSTTGTAAVSSATGHSNNSTASMTSSTTRGSPSATGDSDSDDAQEVTESEGGAARTSTFAGLLGLVALGALAL